MSERRDQRLAAQPAVARPVHLTPAGPATLISQLQRQAGNAAVASLFIQRAAIDQPDPEVDGVVDRLRIAVRRDVMRRRIEVDVEKAEAALAGLTHEQGRRVKQVWLEKDGRPLPELLLGEDSMFPSTSLRPDQFKELMNLLGGTRAVDPGNAGELNDARERVVVVEAAKLHDGLRQGASGKEAVFAALAALHLGTAEEKALLERVYAKHFRTVAVIDLNTYLSGRDLQRALALFTGDTAEAEAVAIEQQVEVKRDLQHPTSFEAVIKREDRQHQADAAIEEHLSNLREGGGVESALRKPGHGALLTDLDAVSHGDSAAVQHALIEKNESRLVAARLARLHHEGKLTARDIERELTGLREAIDKGVNDEKMLAARLRAAFMELEVAFIAQTQESLRYVISITGSKGPRLLGFGDATVALEPDAEQERNAELLRGYGVIVDDDRVRMFQPPIHVSGAVLDLDLAVREGDVARLRKALAGKTRKQVEKLAEEYQSYTHRDLKTDVLGTPQMQKAARMMPGVFDNEKLAEKAEALEGDTFESSDPWVTKDSVEHRLEEARWIHQRIGSLYERVVENRGLFAQARDWLGDIEKNLVDDARKAAETAYRAIIADPKHANIEKQLNILRKCQARLEHNVEVYKEATKEAFDEFVEAAVVAVTAALTMGEGGVLFTAWRTILGTAGTKFVLKGEDYSLKEFSTDVLEGVAGSVGSKAGEVMLGEAIGAVGGAAQRRLTKANIKLPAWTKTAAAAVEHTAKFAGEQSGSGVLTWAATGKEPSLAELAQEGIKDLLKVAMKSRHHEAAEPTAGGKGEAAEHANVIELPKVPHAEAEAARKATRDYDVEEHIVPHKALTGGYDESVLKKIAIEKWEGGGDNQLVKVVSAERGTSKAVHGYVTELKYVRGRNLAEIEQVLGLPEGELANGAVVHTLDGVPGADQFKLKAYTQLPEGKTWHPPGRYPPGLGAPQWELTSNIPVAESTTVAPNQRYQPGAPSRGNAR